MNEIFPIYNLDNMTDEERQAVTHADVDKLQTFFEKADLRSSPALTLHEADIDGWHVKDYETIIVSRARQNGELYVYTADNHIVNVSKMLNTLHGFVVRS